MTTTGLPSNWGRWGAQDQRGALNLLTPERVARALAAPRQGRVYTLGAEVSKRGVITGKRNATWHVVTQVQDPDDPGRGRAEDVLTMHTHAHTHIDGLAHAWFDGKLYNGVPAQGAVGRGGTRHGGVDQYGGIIGEAVVLDVTAVREIGPGVAITAEDLNAAATRTGVDPAAADILLIRTAWTDVFARDPELFEQGYPGLAPDGAKWVAEQDPAVLGMDAPAFETVPPPPGVDPLACHHLFLHRMGIPLIESMDLAEIAADGVTGGLFMAAPLQIKGGLGSPVNPLLVV
ncbi:MAG TPA: cyclase family protein [Trebonia sp.]|nr:cyclase family protein [Trebonia sp.]HVW45315.1 cyclase family protein [Amycolatopsis sp.]